MGARLGSEVWQPMDLRFVVVYSIQPKRISQSSIAISATALSNYKDNITDLLDTDSSMRG
jgi:hypothetical protein